MNSFFSFSTTLKLSKSYPLDPTSRLKISSQESDLYLYKSIVVKVPKKTKNKSDFTRLFYIGTLLNSLSPIVPNFIPTLSLHKNYSISYPYIPGSSLETLLPSLSFSVFLNIYLQILFALEVASRYYSFTHYDLHYNNIILKPIKTPFTYSILLDNKTYTITAVDYIPIIIDFGLSCIHDGTTYIGNPNYSQYNITETHQPGVDMYKLLYYCYAKIENKEIGKLFDFYNNKDPYKMALVPVKNLKAVSDDYLYRIHNSTISGILPIEFISWILGKYKGTCTCVVKDRHSYILKKSNREKINTTQVPSYILTAFLDSLSDTHTPLDFKKIKYDQTMLGNYKALTFPSKDFYKDFLPYLQYYYTIQQLGIEDMFGKFIIEFPLSPQYDYYLKNIYILERERRKKSLFVF